MAVQAFPRDDFQNGVEGMWLRDWFAGQALSGMLAREGESDLLHPASVKVAAQWAYSFADAMMEARDKPTEPK